MKLKVEQYREKIRSCRGVCSFFYRAAVRERRSYPFLLLSEIAAAAIMPFINIIFPKYIIEELMGNGRIYVLAGYVALIVFGNVILGDVICVLQETRNKQEDWFARKFDLMLSEKAMKMEFSNTEKESTIQAEQRAETGMSWYSGGLKGLSDCVVGICAACVTFSGIIFLVLKISPWLIGVTSAAVCINAYCTSKINRASEEVFEKTPHINKFYHYIYTKITFREYAKELRLYDGTELVEKKAVDNAKELNKMDNECAKKQFLWGVPNAAVSAASYGFSYGFLGIQALRGEISVAEFVMCVTAVETLSHGCLLPIINLSQQFVVKSNFMRAFIEFMDLEDQNWMGRCGIGAPDLAEIRFDHVSFRYPGSEQFIIKDISFRIRRGEHISIVGVNGAGKSTLVKLICRLYEPTEGVIYVNGRDIREYDYEEYITLLAVVFQDFKLWGYSLDQNICVAEHLPDDYRQKREALYRASGLIDWVSTLSQGGATILSKEFDEEGTEPSGGLAQKIAIARALYRGAPFLILDEPTAALDPVSEYEIYKRFHEMIKNKTAIYISHRLSSCKFCDRILVIQDRRIREEGTHEELMAKKGIYEKMFSAQAKWYT